MRDVTKDDEVFKDIVRRNPLIDQERLLRELNLACLHINTKGLRFNHNRDLRDAFTWLDSPQGDDLWFALSGGQGFP